MVDENIKHYIDIIEEFNELKIAENNTSDADILNKIIRKNLLEKHIMYVAKYYMLLCECNIRTIGNFHDADIFLHKNNSHQNVVFNYEELSVEITLPTDSIISFGYEQVNMVRDISLFADPEGMSLCINGTYMRVKIEDIIKAIIHDAFHKLEKETNKITINTYINEDNVYITTHEFFSPKMINGAAEEIMDKIIKCDSNEKTKREWYRIDIFGVNAEEWCTITDINLEDKTIDVHYNFMIY